MSTLPSTPPKWPRTLVISCRTENVTALCAGSIVHLPARAPRNIDRVGSLNPVLAMGLAVLVEFMLLTLPVPDLLIKTGPAHVPCSLDQRCPSWSCGSCVCS